MAAKRSLNQIPSAISARGTISPKNQQEEPRALLKKKND
jgi:hypothetical protein